MIQQLLEKSRYLVLIGVVVSLFAALAAFGWGAAKAVTLIGELIGTGGKSSVAKVGFVELMDAFLIATALMVFAFGLYELFIKELDLPQWLVVHSLHDLKIQLSNVIVLVMAITFVERLVESQNPLDTLYYGIAVALVAAALIAFSTLGEKH